MDCYQGLAKMLNNGEILFGVDFIKNVLKGIEEFGGKQLSFLDSGIILNCLKSHLVYISKNEEEE